MVGKPRSESTEDENREAVAVRAAQYVRMSTEHQQYSTDNQLDTIRHYAEQRGIDIIRTYADKGKSGLTMDGREALRRMIHRVETGRADFAIILVYDVSRWGRFQDVDEGAYLEFICRRAGITVQYCAEQFENDGSLSATIIKNMKRAMAGEYSRELSVKVFQGQCRLITLGFRQGGRAGYALRRQLVDENGLPKSILRAGEHKRLQTDRIILVPGPPAEVRTLLRIFRLFVEKRRNEGEIAEILNKEGITTDLGRSWTRTIVHRALTNEKYIGNNVYNRISFKLKKRRIRNPPDLVVRADGAFVPIIDVHLFEAARRIIDHRTYRLTDAQMLERLAALFKRKGRLSGPMIDDQEDMPASWTYRKRFGSLTRAFELVGFTHSRDFGFIKKNQFLRSLYPDAIAELIGAIEQGGGTVVRDQVTGLLNINDEFTASFLIVGCFKNRSGAPFWNIRFDTTLHPDITIAARMNRTNTAVLDYYILPRRDFVAGELKLATENGFFLDAYRSDTLDPFFDLSARASVRRVA